MASGTPADLRAAAPLEVYRVWGGDGRTVARAARTLTYAESARVTGRFVRVHVRRDRTPGRERVVADLAAIDGARFVEALGADMEAMLLSLATAA